MALSCDEAFADFSSQIKERGQGELELAERIRAEIFEATGCSASIGIGDNMLLARVATHKAKPNGAFQILQSDALSYLSTLPVGDLPGVGYHMTAQLEFLKVHTCGDLQQLSISKCKEVFGDVKGQKLWEFCRGIDSRSFSAKARQSVGAEVNWGVRFEALDQIVKFIGELAGEVESRLKKARVKGSQITVKAKEKLYEGEPVKVLGCGACTDHSKSKALPFVTDDGAAIALVAVDLFKSFNIPQAKFEALVYKSQSFKITFQSVQGSKGFRRASFIKDLCLKIRLKNTRIWNVYIFVATC
ncbi:hypothetical protein BC829DRAFT_416123 [Chytridium lagenaria]|nr:hypothetical protein BC829DRAFT_416123 [Chytridium lagenaria]